jgi:predicted RNA binding protein YcfA (HicA-like mRNA interferase family)
VLFWSGRLDRLPKLEAELRHDGYRPVFAEGSHRLLRRDDC